MSEKPILFSAPMVRAILAGTKTQTRRVIKHQPRPGSHHWEIFPEHRVIVAEPWVGMDGRTRTRFDHVIPHNPERDFAGFASFSGAPGTRLWVRETFQRFTDDGEIIYKADPGSLEAMNELKRDECLEARWRPGIHMPRWASRIDLLIKRVWVERLQDISDADAISEGISLHPDLHGRPRTSHWGPLQTYRDLWESINGAGSWEANPWVWCIEFERVKP